jgi:hypothetical protein
VNTKRTQLRSGYRRPTCCYQTGALYAAPDEPRRPSLKAGRCGTPNVELVVEGRPVSTKARLTGEGLGEADEAVSIYWRGR